MTVLGLGLRRGKVLNELSKLGQIFMKFKGYNYKIFQRDFIGVEPNYFPQTYQNDQKIHLIKENLSNQI